MNMRAIYFLFSKFLNRCYKCIVKVVFVHKI